MWYMQISQKAKKKKKKKEKRNKKPIILYASHGPIPDVGVLKLFNNCLTFYNSICKLANSSSRLGEKVLISRTWKNFSSLS